MAQDFVEKIRIEIDTTKASKGVSTLQREFEKLYRTTAKAKGSFKGCFIATACLGENSHILKQSYVFRDELLVSNIITYIAQS